MHPGEITRAKIRGEDHPEETYQIFNQFLHGKSKDQLIEWIESWTKQEVNRRKSKDQLIEWVVNWRGWNTERMLTQLESEGLLGELLKFEHRDNEARTLGSDLHHDQGYW